MTAIILIAIKHTGMNESYSPEPQTSILDDHLNQIRYEEASINKRLFNWLIDLVVMRFTIMYATSYLTSWMLNSLVPDFLYDMLTSGKPFQLLLYTYLIWHINFLFYFFICEKAFRGYTAGKLVTGTRAIRLDGKELTFKDALLRTLCRLIPFETVSALNGPPWHDTWTKTTVINTRR